jgi:hypothetical protein
MKRKYLKKSFKLIRGRKMAKAPDLNLEGGIKSVEYTEAKTEPVKEQQAPKETADKPTERRGRRPKGKDSTVKSFDVVKRAQAIHEPNVAVVTYCDDNKKKLRELATRVYLSAFGIDDEASAVVLNHMYEHSISFEGHKVYGRTLAYITSEVGLSYPTVQRAVKKMVDKAVLKQSEHIANTWEFSNSTNAFYRSIQNNAQIVLTFEPVEEMQTEAINEDGTINQDFL